MTLLGLHFKAQLTGGTLSDNFPVLLVRERGTGSVSVPFDPFGDNRFFSRFDQTSYGYGPGLDDNSTKSFMFNVTLVTANDVDITADVTPVFDNGGDDGYYAYWEVPFDAGLVSYVMYADMPFTTLRQGNDREYRFVFDNAFGGGPNQLFVSDVYFDTGGVPPLRMNQRDDGQGGISGHARLNNGSANQPSSVGDSRSPRLSGVEANRYV